MLMNYRYFIDLLRVLFGCVLCVWLAPPLLAQCLQGAGTSVVALMRPTSAFPLDDEGRSSEIAFVGFQFPIGDSTYSHFVVESNGEVYLTNGMGVVAPAQYGISSLAEMRGGMGASPRVMAISGDLQAGLPMVSWDILVDDAVSNQVKITWSGVRVFATAATFTVSVTLFATGSLKCDYSAGDFSDIGWSMHAGISAGNAVGNGLEQSVTLVDGADSGSLPLLFQNDWQPFGLNNKSLIFAPNGNGGYSVSVFCGLASHEIYGEGCYDEGRESIYQHFTDAAQASIALSGNSLVLSPNGDGYGVHWVPDSASSLYVPPTASAIALPVGNDGQVTFPLSTPFVVSAGVVNELTIQGNGIIGFGPGPVGPLVENWLPQPSRMMASAHGGIYCWHAYNADEGGSVFIEDHGGITCITFLDVESFPLTISNPSTFQVQFHHATGAMTLVFVHVDSDNSMILNSYPQDHVIGFTPPGESIDPGGVVFSMQLPVTTTVDIRSLELTASPIPLSTSATGSTVTYTTECVPESQFGSGIAIGMIAFSPATVSGLSLTALGAPGCVAHVGPVFHWEAFVGLLGAQQVSIALPPGVPSGVRVYAQAVAFSVGVNSAGIITSNAVASEIGWN